MHPVLLPGTHPLRRGPAVSQVGLGPGSLVLDGAPPDAAVLGGDPLLAARLVRAGLALADDRPLRDALPAEGEEPWLRHTLAALARRTRDGLGDVLRRRQAVPVEVEPFGHPLGRQLADELETVLRRSGVRVARRPRRATRGRGPRPDAVRVLVGLGEPSRDLTDGLVRDGTAHVYLRLVEGRAVVGPFVTPGHSACLRCVDAYLREDDPARPLLVQQYARATRTDRRDGIPEPADAALAAVAVGWVARDVATYAEGEDPSTLSRTVTLPPLLSPVEVQHWPVHPHCGCAW